MSGRAFVIRRCFESKLLRICLEESLKLKMKHQIDLCIRQFLTAFSQSSPISQPKTERKVLVLDERVKQLETENEQLRLKTGDRTGSSLRTIKSNLDLMSIKRESNSSDRNEVIVKDEEFDCDDEESMRALQSSLVVLTSTGDDRIDDDDLDED